MEELFTSVSFVFLSCLAPRAAWNTRADAKNLAAGNENTQKLPHVEINQKWSWQSVARDGGPVRQVAAAAGGGGCGSGGSGE